MDDMADNMILGKILPYYEKHSKQILHVFWALFTVVSILLMIATKGENVPLSCISIVSIIGWISIFIYLLFSKIFVPSKNTECDKPLHSKSHPKHLQKILDVLYVVLYIILLLILQFCDVRPLAYYILITILLGCLVVSILTTTSAIDHTINIIKVLIFAALSSMAVFKQFYLAGAIDIGYFAALNEITAKLGCMPLELAGKQMPYPFVHLETAISMIMTNCDIQISSICAVVIPSILLTLCVYAIAKHYVGKRYGLIAMLVSNILAYIIYLRYQANPTEWAWLYYLMLLFAIFLWIRSENKLSSRFGLILVSFILLTMAAHQFSSFIVMFIVISLYIASVLIKGKLITRMLPLTLIYVLFQFIYWLIIPIGGLNLTIGVMWDGLTAEKGYVPLDFEKYVGIDSPSVFDSLLAETPMVIVHCICLLLPLLLIVSNNVLGRKNYRVIEYLYVIVITLIGSLAFFSIIWVGYTGMTIRIGCYIGVIFALGLSFLFAEFAVRASSEKKKVVHCVMVVSIICTIGFVNIAAPMINDDTQLWREDYTITAEWNHADHSSADTVTDILPESFSLYNDPYYGYPYTYFMNVKKYIEGVAKERENNPYYNTYIHLDANTYNSSTFILFKERMLKSPTQTLTRYGNSELETYNSFGYIHEDYQNVLNNRGNKLYDIGPNELYFITH